MYFKPEERSKQGSFYSCLAANITKYARVQTAIPFLVGDRVTCNAAKVLGKYHAKQRYGRLFKEKELLGDVQRIDGKGRSVKYIVYFDEVATSKAFSALSIRRQC